MTPIANSLPTIEKWIQHQIPTASDLCFEKFRTNFPFGGTFYVHPCGTRANISCASIYTMHKNMVRARKVITEFKLPLYIQGFSDYKRHYLHLIYRP